MSARLSIPIPSSGTTAGGRAGDPRGRRPRAHGAQEKSPRHRVLAVLEKHAQQHPLNRALVMLDGDGACAITYVQLAQRVGQLAARLSARFPEGGQRIAILSESSPAWGIVALATIASGNVLVPLDTSMEPDALESILQRVCPAFLASSASHSEAAAALVARGAPLGGVLPLDAWHPDAALPETTPLATRPGDYAPAPETVVVAFTSGTTAVPKAVEIGFDNLVFQIGALTECFALRPSDRLLSLLPMHHMLEFTAGFLCPLFSGAEVHYLDSLLPHDALERIRTLGITRMVTVPAWLALLKRALEHGARSDNSPSDAQLRSHARRAFGADFEHFVCGGAALADEVADFFVTVGAPVFQGYGLTETSPVVATNTITGSRRGSVGRPLAGAETTISADGEILVRGPHVAGRYHLGGFGVKNVADDQGWFHTGDLGHLDGDGFLYVTGRIKTTIVLANGKNVQPEEIETRLQACDAVAEAGVVALGNGNSQRGEEICLVAVPAPDYMQASRPANEHVEQALHGCIREILATLSPHKRPRRVILRDHALPRTAAGKLRRPELAEWAKAQIGPPS